MYQKWEWEIYTVHQAWEQRDRLREEGWEPISFTGSEDGHAKEILLKRPAAAREAEEAEEAKQQAKEAEEARLREAIRRDALEKLTPCERAALGLSDPE